MDYKGWHVFLRMLQLGASLTALSALLPAQATLQISSPADGSVVTPGATVTITITGSGAAFAQAAVYATDPLGFCAAPSGPPFQCSIQVPSDTDAGTYLLTAAALDGTGNETDSAPVTIDVEPPAAPASIAALPASLTNLWIGDQAALRIIGTNSDGSRIELTESTQTTYVPQAQGIITVSADGLVTAVAPGSTTILINGTLSVPVTVDPPISILPIQVSLTASQRRTFVARVTNSTNPAVTWSLNPGLGSVDANGVYTAPVAVASQETDTLTATSVADNTQTASAVITLLPTASVTILPAWAVLYASEPQQFTATTSNAGTAGVTWSVSPSGAGTIDGTGLYTAPASISSTQPVTITAASVANPTIAGSTTIYISPQPFNLLPQLPLVDVGLETYHDIFVAELATDGFPHPVAFSITGLPSGVTASFNPTTLTGTGDTSLTFTATEAAVQGSYTARDRS